MDQSVDTVWVVTQSPQNAQAIQQQLTLRGFDHIACLTLTDPLPGKAALNLGVIIVDGEGNYALTLDWLRSVTVDVPIVMLVEQYDEAQFLETHDLGVMAYLVKPVPNAYFIAQVLNALEVQRLQKTVDQKNEILRDYQAVVPYAPIYSTECWLRRLKKTTEGHAYEKLPLSILLVHLTLPQPVIDQAWATQPAFKIHLKQGLAKQLLDTCRAGDVAGEFLDRSFGLILPNTDKAGLAVIHNRLMQQLQGFTVDWQGQSIAIAVQYGGASMSADADSVTHYEQLLYQAIAEAQLTEVATTLSASTV